MFTVEERERLRDALVGAAESDPDVIAAALVGSAATGREDAWSDVDLALRVRPEADPGDVAKRWTSTIFAEHAAVDSLDIVADGVLYRVFLLASSLQLDISFWPAHQFRATEPGFKILFGTANPSTEPTPLSPARITGMGWLYALHARTAIARGRTWQAVMMLDDLRDQVLALACLRHGLNPHHGRGADMLPSAFLDALADARARSTETQELSRSNEALLRCLLNEVSAYDQSRADRLAPAIDALALGPFQP